MRNRTASEQSERNRSRRDQRGDHQHGVVAINGDFPPHGAHLTVWDMPNQTPHEEDGSSPYRFATIPDVQPGTNHQLLIANLLSRICPESVGLSCDPRPLMRERHFLAREQRAGPFGVHWLT